MYAFLLPTPLSLPPPPPPLFPPLPPTPLPPYIVVHIVSRFLFQLVYINIILFVITSVLFPLPPTGVAVLQGLLFAIGGYLEGKTSTDAVECYNPRTKRYRHIH